MNIKYENVSGTIVALGCPDYVQGINLPGWHLHFISDAKTKGDQLLDASIKIAHAQIDYINNFSMAFPETADFAKLKLKTQQAEEKSNK
ncbi:acetolactate decarboxylase [Cellulosilyticum ruminicola]|uniref:acetolactate decarboxylase n=1 Tax=Cellulosilyticum ruminicola TaxID=425254 RepID=UPI0006CFCFCE|nr:acetolactate decarboxylase [Cellulosilyticum ruminicola]